MIRRPTLRDYLGISVFWFGANFFWGAMLFVAVQWKVEKTVVAETAVPSVRQAVRALSRTAPPGVDGAAVETVATVHSSAASAGQPGRAEKRLEVETNRRLGWLLGLGALVSTFTQLFFGALSDNSRNRFGRRRPFLAIGVMLASLGIVGFFWLQGYALIVSSYLVIQFFLAIALGPYQALLPDLVPLEHEGAAAAYMGLWQLLGRAGGMVAGAILLRLQAGPTILTFLFVGLLNALMVATLLLTREQPLKHRFPGGVWGSLSKLFRVELAAHPSFLWMLASRLAINLGIYTVMPFIQYYLMHVFGLTRSQTLHEQEMIGVIVNVAGVTAAFPAGMLSDRYPKKRIVMVACGVCIAAGTGFALSGRVWMALISAGVFGFGYGAFQSVDWALVCNVLPPGQPAKYMGLWSLGDTLPQIIAPMFGYLIVNEVIAHYSPALGYRAAMAAAMVWFTVGAVLIRFVRERLAEESSSFGAETARQRRSA